MPEIQKEINRNKSALKQLILQYLSMSEEQIGERQRTPGIPFLEKMLGQCLERTCNDGNVEAFRKILEIPFGKIPEDKEPFEINDDEKILVINYRKKLAEQERGALPNSPTDDRGDVKSKEPQESRD